MATEADGLATNLGWWLDGSILKLRIERKPKEPESGLNELESILIFVFGPEAPHEVDLVATYETQGH